MFSFFFQTLFRKYVLIQSPDTTSPPVLPWHFSSPAPYWSGPLPRSEEILEADADYSGTHADKCVWQIRETSSQMPVPSEEKGKIILNVRIWQIGDISVCPCSAQSVKIHDLRCRLSIHLGHKMCPLCHTISVQINGYLNGRICFQNRAHTCLCILIRVASVQLSVDDVIDTFIMDRFNPFLIQKFCQIIPDSYNTGRGVTGNGICKFFLGMGVKIKIFGPFCFRSIFMLLPRRSSAFNCSGPIIVELSTV